LHSFFWNFLSILAKQFIVILRYYLLCGSYALAWLDGNHGKLGAPGHRHNGKIATGKWIKEDSSMGVLNRNAPHATPMRRI
jgi:hypothetical protein